MSKVSVILTSFNHDKYLRESIDCVLGQTFGDFELIIWDDASSDNSWHLIRSYKDERITAFRNDHRKGTTPNLNRAISEVARGQYIAIHHSDDAWEPNKLEKQVDCLDKHDDIGAVFTNATIIGEDSAVFTDTSHFYFNVFNQPNRTRHEWLRFFFRHRNALCHPSVLIRKVCHDTVGLYKPGIFQYDDLDMWIRLCLKYEIHVLSEKLTTFRVRDNEANASGYRRDTKIRGMYELYKILQNYREITRFDDLVKIFPPAAKYYRDHATDVGYALGMTALEEASWPYARLFGQDLLFEAVNDPERRKNIEHHYDWTALDLAEITGQNDVFSIEQATSV